MTKQEMILITPWHLQRARKIIRRRGFCVCLFASLLVRFFVFALWSRARLPPSFASISSDGFKIICSQFFPVSIK